MAGLETKVIIQFVIVTIFSIIFVVGFARGLLYGDYPKPRKQDNNDSQEGDLKINVTIRMEEPKKEMTLQEKRYAE